MSGCKVSPSSKFLWKERKHLSLVSSQLMRSRTCCDRTQLQLVLPKKYWTIALRYVHDQMGHLGREFRIAVVLRIAAGTILLGWHAQDSCRLRLLLWSMYPSQRLEPTTSSACEHNQHTAHGFSETWTSQRGIANVLVITDHFTKYAQVYASKNQTAKVLFENLVVHYGFPKWLHSDQGHNFEGQTIKELCQLAGVDKSRTTPFHPMGNRIAKCFNSTLLNMLGTLEPIKKLDWNSHISPLVHAYNCTRHETTGYAPYFLMFARHACIPVDLVLGRFEGTTTKSVDNYVSTLRQRL